MQIYDIIQSNNINNLIAKTQETLDRGWKLEGGMVVEVYPHLPPKFYQTITFSKKGKPTVIKIS